MLIRIALAGLAAMKAIIRASTKSGPAIDIGDLLLLAILYIFYPLGESAKFESMLVLPGSGQAGLILIVSAGLFLAGRALASIFRMDEKENIKGVSAGGAARSLRFMSRRLALAIAIPFCIPAAFLEELVFRGLLYSALCMRIGPLPANLVQAAAFALVHAAPAAILKHRRGMILYASIFPFLCSIVLQMLFVSSSSIIGPAFVHVFLNVSAAWRAKLGNNEGIL